jgi:hypothetical protein
MALTGINSEDRLVQKTFADHLRDALGWDSVYAYNTETLGPNGTLGRGSERDAVLKRDLRGALERRNPEIPHNAFLVVSNGDRARYGSITSKWEHSVEWKRDRETDRSRSASGEVTHNRGTEDTETSVLSVSLWLKVSPAESGRTDSVRSRCGAAHLPTCPPE